MMLTHSWIDQYAAGSHVGDSLRNAALSAVQFDCGDVEDIPVGNDSDVRDARPPFPRTLLQFSLPPGFPFSHVMIIWVENPDGEVLMIMAQRLHKKEWMATGEDEWRTAAPVVIAKSDDGIFHYRMDTDDEATKKGVRACCASALNFFYVLGCSNVATADNQAPTALNKKRAKSGKFPIFEYKTLVVNLDRQRINGQPGGGTHASPRVHLRRGHVRRIDADRRVWVQACVVGSTHGMVLKDYRVQCSGR